MEWNQLQCFLAVAKEENISKAADRLYLSQPALSQAIKRLEEELGYPLFHRNGRRIVLNKSGEIFMQTVTQINHLMDTTRLRLEEMNHISHPNVTIHLATASQLLPQLLPYLKGRNPQVQYHIHQWPDKDFSEEADISIVARRVDRKESLLSFPPKQGTDSAENISSTEQIKHLLLKEDILLALPKGHPLLTKDTLHMEDLKNEEFICLTERWELGRETVKELRRLWFTPKATIHVDNPNMMRELLKAHLGVAFVPATTWKSFTGEDILLRPVAEFQMSRYIYLHTKANKYLTKEQRDCIAGIEDFFKTLARKDPTP